MQVPEREKVFTNHGRWHPLWRLTAFSAVLLAIAVLQLAVAGPVAYAIYQRTGQVDAGTIMAALFDSPGALVVYAWAALAIAIVGTCYFTVRLDRQPAGAVGLWPHRGWQREAAAGLGLGIALIAAVFAILLAAGLARVRPSPAGPVPALVIGIAVLLPLATMEEVLFRGYTLRNLAQWLGPWWGLAVSAVLFSLGHFANPQPNPLALANVGLAGVLMGYAYLRSGSLWLACGLHFAWNFAQGTLFGMPVSGLGIPGLIHTELPQPYWVTGGPFGPEGSIVATVALLGGLAYLRWRYRAGERSRMAELPVGVEEHPPGGE